MKADFAKDDAPRRATVATSAASPSVLSVSVSVAAPEAAATEATKAYYIFSRGVRPQAGWELLATLERVELAEEVCRNYRWLFRTREGARVERVGAASAERAKAEKAEDRVLSR